MGFVVLMFEVERLDTMAHLAIEWVLALHK